ncbi:MAG: hypothetical protein R6X25_00060 [Candidatus Krumholzibacteriia bacterium]
MDRIRVVLSLLVVIAPAGVTAQMEPCTNFAHSLHEVAFLPSGGVQFERILASGDTVCLLTNADTVRIVDVSDPLAPCPVADIPVPGAVDFCAVGDYLHVASTSGGLATIALANPLAGVIHTLPVAGSVTCIGAGPGHLYLGGTGTGLVVCDLTDPAAPSLAGTIPYEGGIGDLAVLGGYLYSAAEFIEPINGTPYGRLQAWSLAMPASPAMAGYWDYGFGVVGPYEYEITGLTVHGDRLWMQRHRVYWDDTDPVNPTAIHSYANGYADLSDPAAPGGGSSALDGRRCTAAADGATLFAVSPTSPDFDVYDLTYAPELHKIGLVELSTNAADLVLAGHLAYVCGADGMAVVDITDPRSPLPSDVMEGTGLFVGEGLVLRITYDPGGQYPGDLPVTTFYLHEILPDATLSTPLGSVSTSYEGGKTSQSGVVFAQGHFYWGNDVVIATDPTAPALGSVSGLDLVATDGTKLFNFTGSYSLPAELTVLGLTDPLAPEPIGTLVLPVDWAGSIACDYADGRVYFLGNKNAGWDQLCAVDVTTPEAPIVVDTWDISREWAVTSFEIRGGLALFSCGAGGLKVYDLGAPADPLLASVLDDHVVNGTVSTGAMVYVETDVDGIWAVDLASPAAPVVIGSFDRDVRRVDALGRVLVGDQDGVDQVFVLPVACSDLTAVPDPTPTPAAIGLVSVAPNPFNPKTTIRFELPSRAAVTLRVFDVAGRLVRVLMEGEIHDRGRHEAVWLGRDDAGRRCASGTFFCRFEAGTHVETTRMTLVK